MLLASLTLALTTEGRSSEHSRLADHGRTARARIEHVEMRVKRRHQATLAIAFETADGTTVRNRIDVTRSLGMRARDDASFKELDVVYLPEDPSVVRPAGQRDDARWRYLLAAVPAAGGVWATLQRLRRSPA
ncbi:MAG TPA: hypothetical protein VGD42_04250 [Lysobacter sp.]